MKSDVRQPVMEITPENDTSIHEPEKPLRIPIVSPNFYPLTVLCWVLCLATVAILVGLVCTEFFAGYTSVLDRLSGS